MHHKKLKENLHSTVVLLKLSAPLESYQPGNYLHSTVVLLKRTHHCNKFLCESYLHSTVVLLKLENS